MDFNKIIKIIIGLSIATFTSFFLMKTCYNVKLEELSLKKQTLTNFTDVKYGLKDRSFNLFKNKYKLSDTSKCSYDIAFKRIIYYNNSDSVLNEFVFDNTKQKIDSKDSLYIKAIKNLYIARESYGFYLMQKHYKLLDTKKNKIFNSSAEPIYYFPQ